MTLITADASTLTNFRAPLIGTLRGRGVQLLALAPNFDGARRAAVEALGATPVDCSMSRTGMNPLVDIVNTWRMARVLRRLKPDVTLGYAIKPVIYGSIAARLAGVPHRFAMVEGLGFVFTPGSGGFSFRRKLLKRLVLWLYKIGMACAERVIFLNPDDPAELAAAGVLPSGKSYLLGGIGVDLSCYVASPPPVASALPDDKPAVTFLFVGRLLAEKGIHEYVVAAKRVKARYPQTRFIVLGGLDEGNPGGLKQQELDALVAQNVVEYPGFVTNMPDWLARADVFVLPSYYREGVPASTQEAMAVGRAVLTTNVPGCRETVVDGVNGFLVPPWSPEKLAEKMLYLIEHPEEIVAMGQASREMAEEKFDAVKVNRRLCALLGIPESTEGTQAGSIDGGAG